MSDACTHLAGAGCWRCCTACNYATHRCHGCGTSSDHQDTTCAQCVVDYDLADLASEPARTDPWAKPQPPAERLSFPVSDEQASGGGPDAGNGTDALRALHVLTDDELADAYASMQIGLGSAVLDAIRDHIDAITTQRDRARDEQAATQTPEETR